MTERVANAIRTLVCLVFLFGPAVVSLYTDNSSWMWISLVFLILCLAG